MKFETATQAAERLGVTVRAVQKWAKEGKLSGAKKVGRDWMIPVDDTAQTATAVTTQNIIPYPFFQVPYTDGDMVDKVNHIKDNDRHNIALAQLYYFTGDLEKTIEITEMYLDSPIEQYRISAALFYAFANLCGDHIHKTRFAANIIYDAVANIDFNDMNAAEDNANKIFASVVLKTQLHIPFENLPLIEDHMKYMSDGLKMMSCYLSAYKAYLNKDYARSLGIAQTAINCSKDLYAISEMYCNIICAIDYINLLQIDKATEYIKKAWDIAQPHNIFMPIVEHYSILQGLIENNFKKSYPRDYEKIIALARKYNTGWYTVYNARNEEQVTHELTPNEFTIAMLYSRGWRAKEIASHIHISERTVSNYIQIIYEKLNINSRKALENYLLK